MKRLLTSAATIAVAAVATGGLFAGLSPSAFAAGNPPWEPDGSAVGGLTFYNSTGAIVTGGNLTDSPIAAYVQGSAPVRSTDTKATLLAYTPVDGQPPGQWSGEALSTSTTYPNTAAPNDLGTSPLPLVTGKSGDESLSGYIGDFPNNDTSTTDGYAGLYQLRLKTSANGVGPTTQYDEADIQVTGSTWKVVYDAQTATTTGLTASPSSPQLAGTQVTLNATVSPSYVDGTVQFEDGTTDIGSPVTVVSGAASTTTSSLPVGTHTLNAVFTPASAAYTTSTGSVTGYQITKAPAVATTTALSVNPTSAAEFTNVTLTANVSVTSTSAALTSGDGSVQFEDNGADIGQPVNLASDGSAQLTDNSFAQGSGHSITATFTPTDPTDFNASTSSAVPLTITGPQYAPASQTVDVNVPAGTLTITSPYSSSNPFNLGNAVVDPSGGFLSASAPFGTSSAPGVTITDERAGDQPWTASATVTDFEDGASTPDVINGQNLTFTGVTVVPVAGNALTAQTVATTDIKNSQVYAPGASGSDGLKGSGHTFASAAQGDGTVGIDGILTLKAPSSTPAGQYTATLTFTIA